MLRVREETCLKIHRMLLLLQKAFRSNQQPRQLQKLQEHLVKRTKNVALRYCLSRMKNPAWSKHQSINRTRTQERAQIMG